MLTLHVKDLHNRNICNRKVSKRYLFKLRETATSKSSFIFITFFIKTLTEWQRVLLWVPPLKMHVYAFMKKNGLIIVESTLKLSIYKMYIIGVFVLF